MLTMKFNNSSGCLEDNEINSIQKNKLKGFFAPRPVKFKGPKMKKSSCTLESMDSIPNYCLLHDRIAFQVSNESITINSSIDETLVMSIKDLYGRTFFQGTPFVHEFHQSVTSTNFPWNGDFLIEIRIGDVVVAREPFMKKSE